MDKNRHNDNLEQFFRKGLTEESHFSPEVADWDMPSDSVWDGIEEAFPVSEVKAPSRQIVKYWWAVAAGILFLVFCFTTFYSQRKINNLQEQIAVQSDQLKELEERTTETASVFATPQSNSATELTSDITSSPVVGTGGAAISNTSTIQNSNKQNNHLPNGEQIEINTTIAKADARINNGGNNITTIQIINNGNAKIPFNIPAIKENEATPESPGTEYVVTSPTNDNNITANIIKEGNQTIAALALDAKQQPLWSPEPLKTIDHVWSIKPVITPKKNRWYAGVFFGPSLFKAKTKKKGNETDLAKAAVTNRSGFETGVRAGWQINRNWSVETGLAVAKNTTKVKQKLTFGYNPNSETANAEGNLESTYSAELRTDYGDIDVALDLSRRPNQLIAPGEPFEVDLENEMTSTFLQIPLALRYGLQKGKFNISMSAGLLLSALQSQELDLPKNRSMHPRLQHERARLNGKKPGLNKLQYAAQSGVQIAYSPTTTVDFYLAPTYAIGLSPVFENDKKTTYLTQASIQAGVNVHF